MTDTFGEFIPDDWVWDLLDAMAAAPQHTFQVLTKRPRRMHRLVTEWLSVRGLARVPGHIQLVLSAGNQKLLDARKTWLLKTSAVRGLSCEPLLGPMPQLPVHKVDWVIAGGESGPKCRPMEADWVTEIRDQCVAAGVPFFFKQWGHRRNNPDPNDPTAKHNGGKAKGGRMLDGRLWDQMPVAMG
jgi:protein gp37